jgi:hypothetical protein
MGKRPRAVRLAVPAAFVAILALVALWRVSAPAVPASGTSAEPEPLAALTQIAEVLADNSVGRRAALEQVVIRDVASPRAVWVGDDEERVFAVLDPDVKNESHVPIRAGARVTLIGLVRAAPPEDQSIKQWALDASTAKTIRERGAYLHVTEIRAAAD